ncbi:hypothetical protein [Mycobacterium sp. 852002-51971_SCH5477799-a]|uniref:hypothetical protein n=1 Tax=Mycobacterium sp. 852002-51971_SCH5477799-a TaxID=1834106 RepID=UPI0012E8F332|nr:hypothetical protein [Mycobacterium sp. 852002-51971_SCH5477799-a]
MTDSMRGTEPDCGRPSNQRVQAALLPTLGSLLVHCMFNFAYGAFDQDVIGIDIHPRRTCFLASLC